MTTKKSIASNFRISPLAQAIGSVLLLGSVSAYAAEQEQDADKDADRIVVTAQGRQQTVQEIPYNISAISGEELERSQIIDQSELMRHIPGVSVVDRGYRNSGVMNGIMIRGLNVDSSTLGDYQLSTVPTVSTYVNNTPIFANFILKDIDRVEVLRGPQGTLYGSGSLGGTVRYLMREPELEDFNGRVSASYSVSNGSDGNNTSLDAMLNLPLGDMLALRLIAGTVDYDGVTDYVNIYKLDANGVPVAPADPTVNNSSDPAIYISKKDADTVDVDHLRASFMFRPSNDFSLLFSHQKQEDDIGGRRQFTRGVDGWGNAYGDGENGSVQLEPSQREVKLNSLEMMVDLGFATLTASGSDYEHEGESISENTGYYAQNQWLANFYYNYPRPMATAARAYDDEARVYELRLVSNSDGAFDWLVGYYQADQDLGAAQLSFLQGFKAWADAAWGVPSGVIDDNDFAYARIQTVDDRAIFGELTWHIGDDWHASVGLRQYDTSVDNDTFMSVSFYEAFKPEVFVQFGEDDDGTLSKFNLSYDINDNLMMYVTRSEGYRHGGANAVPLQGFFAEDASYQSFQSDSVINYEVGIKGDNANSQYTVALFNVDWDDIQLNVATPNWGFFAAQNGGKAHTQGLEAQFRRRFDSGVTLDVGYTYVEAELDDDVYRADDSAHAQTPIARSGAQLPGSAKNTLNVGVSHTFYSDRGLAWTSRLGAYHQSESENSISSSPRFAQTLDAFSLFDASLTVAGEVWDSTLFIKNIGDEAGVTGVIKDEYMGTAPAQNYYGNGNKEFVTVPRTIGVAFNFRF